MKRSRIIAALSCDLPQFERDSPPDEAEFIAGLGGPGHADRFHTLRKAGLIEIENGRYVLS